MKDARQVALEIGIGQLDTEDILKIFDFPSDQLLLDGGNFSDGKYCPLAVALDAHWNVYRPNNESVGEWIGNMGRHCYGEGFIFNQMKGTPGDFYRERRMEDLTRTAMHILAGRSKADVNIV